ncbi:MAG: fumarylacetoacetate hydrolase family protein [Nitrospirae bacterium]|nr:fumarylacetoacetate hydrolase family protein [Nitrospirota bacterium]MBI5695103.1 fumarylacetoacetate hydrolase family protein [Nitrospirota bacterium]
MRLVRYIRKDKEGCGILEENRIQPVEDLFGLKKSGRPFDMVEARLLAPTAPSKIICAGLNYMDHAAEMNMPIPSEPIIFMKPPSAVLGPGGVIKYPNMSHQVEHEAELGVVIGKTTKDVTPEGAAACIRGYTCFNDVTARDLQKKDGQWTRAKSFDTFAVFGPWIETELDPFNVMVEAYLNGAVKQSSSTANMIFPVYGLVSFISRVMTLLPGDVIATGTPPGIGPMKVGDEIEIRITGIGTLYNTIGM